MGLEDHKDVHQQGEEVVRDRDEEEEESVNKVLSRKSLFSSRKENTRAKRSFTRENNNSKEKERRGFCAPLSSTRGQMPTVLFIQAYLTTFKYFSPKLKINAHTSNTCVDPRRRPAKCPHHTFPPGRDSCTTKETPRTFQKNGETRRHRSRATTTIQTTNLDWLPRRPFLPFRSKVVRRRRAER